MIGLLVKSLEELPSFRFSNIQLVNFASWTFGVESNLRCSENPAGQMTPGRIYVLGTSLDGVFVLVAGHADDVEE